MNAQQETNQFSLSTIFAIVTAVCLIAAYPRVLLVLPILFMLAIGTGCIYSSVRFRNAGWISGLLFGIILLVATIALSVVNLGAFL